MRLSYLLFALAVGVISSFVEAVPSPPTAPLVKETIVAPPGWEKTAAAPPERLIDLRIGLYQSNFPLLEQRLYEVSHPDHERYGAHLSKEEVEDLIRPHADSVAAVENWLAAHGLSEEDVVCRSPAGDWITVRVPIRIAEILLHTTYHVWTHAASGKSLIRTTSYSLPQHINNHVELIQPTTIFSLGLKALRTEFVLPSSSKVSASLAAASAATGTITTSSGLVVNASCNSTIDISCLKQLYNVGSFVPSARSENVMGITGFLEEYPNFKDFSLFNAAQGIPQHDFPVISINGGQDSQNISLAGFEADLDIEYGYGLAYPIHGAFYTTGGSPLYNSDDLTPTNTNEPYTDFLDYILAQSSLPATISTSYDDDEQTVPYSYATRVCAQFAELGARGVSLLFASGDYGVGDGNPDPATQRCFSNNGSNAHVFIPNFPASCPYVTSVGATQDIEPEVAVYEFSSGGGFSNYFPRPWYQEYAVSSYLEKLAPGTYAGLYNSSGRGIPDVAAQGCNFKIYTAGNLTIAGGTSASTPTFTGIISLVNDVRLSRGLPPLGFLNPFIYTKGFNALNDITIGNSTGCGTSGFHATEGWDPVTGYGTPNFGKLVELALSF